MEDGLFCNQQVILYNFGVPKFQNNPLYCDLLLKIMFEIMVWIDSFYTIDPEITVMLGYFVTVSLFCIIFWKK